MECYFIMNVNSNVVPGMKGICWVDEFEVEPDRVVLTRDELFIPGLRTFGHQIMRSAAPSLQLHYHKDAFELVLVTSGDVSFYVNNAEYKPVIGEVHLVQPNIPHSTRNKPLTNGEIYWFQLDVLTDGPLFLSRQAGRMIIQRLKEIGTTVLRLESTWQQQLVVDAFKLASTQYFAERYRIAAYLALFLTILAKPQPQKPVEHSKDIQRATAYICAHLRENIRLDAVADAAGLSLSYFKAKFKREMLNTPRTYINRQKIELAKELLLQSGNITSVAEELSFDTPAYFSSVFRKFMAITPTQYIRENIGKQ